MPDQVGVQSGARVARHSHTTATDGGVTVTEGRTVGAAVVIANGLGPKSTIAPGFTLVKEIVINEASLGTMTVFFTVERTAGAGAVNGRLYINGAAVGVDTAANPGPQINNAGAGDAVALNLVIGDRIQVYAHGSGANTATIDAFELRYSNSFLGISGHILTVPLASNYATPIATYDTL